MKSFSSLPTAFLASTGSTGRPAAQVAEVQKVVSCDFLSRESIPPGLAVPRRHRLAVSRPVIADQPDAKIQQWRARHWAVPAARSTVQQEHGEPLGVTPVINGDATTIGIPVIRITLSLLSTTAIGA
jgi:hypothetical protein